MTTRSIHIVKIIHLNIIQGFIKLRVFDQKRQYKESTNQLKVSKDKYLEQQNQQITDAASNISYTTDKINESVNKFQDDNRRALEKSADTFMKYEEQMNKTTQEILNNALELQKKCL
jgi:regulatory protein YycI of two-component signal transduction system YycFG